MLKEISVQDVIDAIKKNGLPWGKGAYFRNSRGELKTPLPLLRQEDIGAACVMGQAAYNLHILVPSDLVSFLDHIVGANGWYDNLGSHIIDKNDSDETESYETVAEYAETLLTPYKDKTKTMFVYEVEQ